MKNFSKRLSVLLAVIMVLSLFAPLAAVSADDSTVSLTVIGTSDMHGNILPYDYYSLKAADQGLAKVYSVVKEIRAKNPNTLLIDNGDTIQGTPLVYYYNMIDTKSEYPMMKVMNYMGYDAWELGNHEFNYGLGVLDRIVKDAKFPVLGANIYKADGTNYVKPYVIKDVNGVKVAILGMITKGVPNWENPGNYSGLKFNDIVTEGQKWVKVLKEQEKVDVIIASVHSGIERTNDTIQEDQVKALANACPEITAIISGHAHNDIAAQTENGVLIVQPKRWGERVSQIDLSIKKENGKWVVASKTSKNINTKDYAPAQEILDLAKPYTDTTDTYVNTVLGKSSGEFSGVGQQIKDTALMDLVQQVQMYYGKADISVAASFNESSRIPSGDVKTADINGLYIYENFLYTIEVTGKQVKDYMEYSAKYFNQYKPGDTAITFDSNVAGYNYDMLQGMDYQLDLTQPVGQRVLNLTYKGKPVRDDQVFKMALNNYRYNGGGGHLKAAGIVNPKVTYDSMKELGDDGQVRTLIMNYIKERKNIDPVVDNNYFLITTPNTRYITKAGDTYSSIMQSNKVDYNTFVQLNNLKQVDNLYAPLPEGKIVLVPKSYNLSKISLLTMNDFHGSLAGDAKNAGVKKLATYFDAQKKLNPTGTILLSAGDMFQGSADSNLLYGRPVLAMMNDFGFEAMAIGNHEFDWGLDKLQGLSDGANFPFLAANIVEKGTDKTPAFAQKYVIVERDGIKVGIIGLATLETLTKTKASNIAGFDFKDPAETVNALVPEVKKAGADVIVVLSHMGASQDSKTKVITGEAADLAKAVKGVDAIVAGHSHQTVAGTVNNIPVVQGYYNGRAVGHIDLFVDKDTKTVVNSKVSTDSSAVNAAENERVKDWFDYALSTIAPIKNEVIGKAAVEIPHEADKTQITLMGQWTTDVMRKAANADIAIQNGGGLRRGFPAGDITMGLMYELMPFDNTLYTMDLTGKQVRAALEHGIMSTTMKPGQFSGVIVKYDSSKPAGERIVEVRLLDGSLLDDSKIYKVVTNDFQAGGGDGYVMFKDGKNQVDTGIPVRDVLVNDVKAKGTLAPVDDGRLIDVKGSATSFIDNLPLAA